jgi:hypothetical protein
MSDQSSEQFEPLSAPRPAAPAWAPPAPNAPAGYVVYGGMPRSVQPTAGLRNWSVITRLGGSVISAIAGVLYFERAHAVDQFRSGVGGRSAIDDAKTLITVVTQFASLVSIGGWVLLCLWSARTVTNGTLVHPNTRASSGLAGGGWFIPVGNCWVPFRHLRRAMGNAPRSTAIGWWQGLTIASTAAAVPLVIIVVRVALRDGLRQGVSAGSLRAQGAATIAGALFGVITTIVSVRAMRDVDEATTGPGGRVAV